MLKTAWIQNLGGLFLKNFVRIKLNGELLYNIYKSDESTDRRSIVKRVLERAEGWSRTEVVPEIVCGNLLKLFWIQKICLKTQHSDIHISIVIFCVRVREPIEYLMSSLRICMILYLNIRRKQRLIRN